MNKKILLIEDIEIIREHTSALLQLGGYQVITADSGSTGVELAINETPDLILCDISMPVLDGFEVLQLLSKNPKTAHIPFIFLTAKTHRHDFRRGMELGAEDYITKPFDETELFKAIEARFKKHEMLKRGFASHADPLNEFLSAAKSAGKIEFRFDENREVQTFRKKHIVFKQGDHPRYLYFVHRGKVKTYKVNEAGKELITAIYKEGDFMGFIALYKGTSYIDTAEALEDAELMITPREEFISAISRDIDVAAKFIKLLSKDVEKKEDQLMSLAYNSLRKRVADGLLRVLDKFKQSADDKPTLEISREDLAQLIGVARESLIRTLSEFKREKMLEIDERKIVILDESKLKSLVN